jgi:hypothetical protein
MQTCSGKMVCPSSKSDHFSSSLPDLIRQSSGLVHPRGRPLDARVKPAHDGRGNERQMGMDAPLHHWWARWLID